MEPLRLGISSCLLGDRVRYDGDHKRQDFLAGRLDAHAKWVRVCPEVELGLGVPREPILLVRQGRETSLIAEQSRRDLTEAMISYADDRIATLPPLDGYVLKHKSPSCGITDVRVAPSSNAIATPERHVREGQGVFAARLLKLRPWLPAIEEWEFEDAERRAHALERLIASQRVRLFREGSPSAAEVKSFVEGFELQLLTRSPEARRALDKIAQRANEPSVLDEARSLILSALGDPPSKERVAGVLRRCWNRLESTAGASDRAAMIAALEGWQASELTYAPIEPFAQAARAKGDAVLLSQTFLHPDPRETTLREDAN